MSVSLPSVLIIDDRSEIVEELIEMLGLMAIVAVGANSMKEGVMHLTHFSSISVALIDVHLNDGSGYDIISRVRSCDLLAGRKIKYVFMTGDADYGDYILPEPHDILLKPIKPRTMIDCIQSALHG